MQRYAVTKFDADTFIIFDQVEQREICVCSNYDDLEDAKERAKQIADLLNSKQ